MPAVFEFPLRVSEADLDGVIRHVNNLVYLKWMQSAAVAHSAVQGWTAERYQELGAGWVVRSHHIEYLRAAFANDEIIVRTWVANLKKVTSLRRFEIVSLSAGRKPLLADCRH